MRITVSVWQKW